MNNRKKNKEGYADLTAFYGMRSQIRTDTELENEVRELVHLFRRFADVAGFDIENRIVFRHRKTGKVFR